MDTVLTAFGSVAIPFVVAAVGVLVLVVFARFAKNNYVKVPPNNLYKWYATDRQSGLATENQQALATTGTRSAEPTVPMATWTAGASRRTATS